ncbi:sensor histidine kinase [Clostridium sp. UBA4548]|uniref:sensor histidine kinase n=1 Tax=Clostridium sp. UBA4548 TaxID=1946361 RepID=UPI0025C338F2|nr:ATP-binding protein [Clostridium sp. UBA4548]
MRLRSKLIISNVIVSLISIILVGILSMNLLESNYKKLIQKNIEDKTKGIVQSIEKQYKSDGWNLYAMENIGIDAMNNGLILEVVDNNNEVIWDAMEFNHGMCQNILQNVSNNTRKNSKAPIKYVTKTFELIINNEKQGIVNISYYGPFYYRDNDLVYLNSLRNAMVFVAIFALILSIAVGLFISTKLSNMISKVVTSTSMISKGNYNMISNDSNISEMNTLVEAVNNLSSSLRKQEQLRKVLTKDISHELRTPLTTLQGNLEGMIDGIWEPTEERLQSCNEEVSRLYRLVGDLENLAKTEEEQVVLNKSNINIGNLISNILSNFEKKFLDKDIILHYESKDVFLQGDKDKLSQAIINILSNGEKYTLQGGHIYINVGEEKDKIIIKIKDTGIGIDREHLPFIFERFYRVDESRTRATGGSGIGLAITKSIIEAHDGRVEVKSIINKGSEFTISLPK